MQSTLVPSRRVWRERACSCCSAIHNESSLGSSRPFDYTINRQSERCARMSFHTKYALKPLAAVVVSMALVFAAATPASAATCRGGSCTGKDPQSTGCSADGTTVVETGNERPFRVQLRFSETCRAAWARGSYATSLTISVERRAVGSSTVNTRYTWVSPPASAGGRDYTNMISWIAPYEYRACANDGVLTACTGWVVA